MKRAFAFMLVLLMLSVSAFAQTVTPAPELLNFQGRLAKPDGTPVADGTYTLRFSLWSALSGGTEKWFQVMNPVVVKNGTFAVLLGNGNPLTADIVNGATYLEIKVGSDAPLTPRQQITSVAYALKANTVPDGAITTSKLADGAITAAKLGAGIGAVLGGVPSGYLILGYAPTAPSGYTFTGDTVSSSAAWTHLPPLPQPRTWHPAVATVNGKFYVIGGYDYVNYASTTYILDTASGIWSQGTKTPTERAWTMTAVVNGQIHVIGGQTKNGKTAVHEVFDPSFNPPAGGWTTEADLPMSLFSGCAVADNSSSLIYVIGGADANGNAQKTIYVYDAAPGSPTYNTWQRLPDMPTARSGAAAAIVGQNIYVIGGVNSGGILATNEMYDIAHRQWSTRASMPAARANMTAALFNGKIEVMGGGDIFIPPAGNYPTLTTNEEYDPIADTWSPRPALTLPRAAAGAVTLNNSIYLFGGGLISGFALTTNDVYTPGKVYYVHQKN